MTDTIKVHVVDYGAGRNLMMRYLDPYTGRQVAKSGHPQRKGSVAGSGEVGRRFAERPLQVSVACDVGRVSREVRNRSGGRFGRATQTRVSGVFDAVEDHINPERVRDVTSERLSHYVKKLRKAGLAESTIASHLAHLRAALTYAVEWGYLADTAKAAASASRESGQDHEGAGRSRSRNSSGCWPTWKPW